MTILELLITMALLGIVAALALPSMMDGLGRSSARAATRSFTSALSLARSEAVKTGSGVSICPSLDGEDCAAGSWSTGWIVFIDADGEVTVTYRGQPRRSSILAEGQRIEFRLNPDGSVRSVVVIAPDRILDEAKQ